LLKYLSLERNYITTNFTPVIMYLIGEKIPAKELTDYLDNMQVRTSPDDDRNADVFRKNLGAGWLVDHVAYKPALRLAREPGFVVFLKDPERPNDAEPMELPYGPKVRDAVLAVSADVYWVRNVEKAVQAGWTAMESTTERPERLRFE
jgi:hypothetical protein